MRFSNRLGDADIVCISPQNKAYVIDVKSHKAILWTVFLKPLILRARSAHKIKGFRKTVRTNNKGEVITDGRQLYRRMGRTTYPFEKNFLEQAMKQALQVKKQKGLSFVTPIVAFSDAKVLVASDKLQNVYVVENARLVALLKSLG